MKHEKAHISENIWNKKLNLIKVDLIINLLFNKASLSVICPNKNKKTRSQTVKIKPHQFLKFKNYSQLTQILAILID